MNPADMEKVKQEMAAQAAALHHHEDQFAAMEAAFRKASACHNQDLETLNAQLQQLMQASQTPVVPPPTGPSVPIFPGPEPRLSALERFSGAPGTCRSFLTLCKLTFELQPLTYPTERSRVAFMITQLTGRARDWGTAEWEKQSTFCSSVTAFSEGLRKVFEHATPGREAARGLLNLVQGSRRVTDYSIEFRTLAAESDWNASSLTDAFYNGLSDDIKDELAARDPPEDLDALVATAIRIDRRLQERRRERALICTPQSLPRPPASPPTSRFSPPAGAPRDSVEPMQLGRTRLSAAERQRRQRENCCMYCGQGGHYVSSCPVKDRAHQGPRGRW